MAETEVQLVALVQLEETQVDQNLAATALQAAKEF